ncbi:MAG: CpaF family protein [Halobacteriovoraceae bacterium]|jgi:pilus assembly protein CpaF|nr:CpaF family protein [Halobacteriovoraceae bacterium]
MSNSVWKLIEELNLKSGISEIIINSPTLIYIERDGDLIRLNAQINAQDLEGFCQEIANKNHVVFNEENPILDGVLPDGSRINIISSLYTTSGPAVTIRKYLKEINSFDTLDGKFNISDKWIKFMQALVSSKSNVMISGGTGVGKTTFLNLMLQEISPTERIVTIEDTRELSFKSQNTVRLLTANANSRTSNPLDMRALVKNSLRMRPDRIIIGEIRGAEAFDLMQVMNTGHEGSMCTVHANSPGESLLRLENLIYLSGFDIPLQALRYQIQTAIDFIIQLERDRDTGRLVSRVTEVCGMEGDKILLQDIGEKGVHGLEFTGLVPMNAQQLIDGGLTKSFFLDI